MIPRSKEEYQRFIDENSNKYSQKFEIYDFSKFHLEMNKIPMWALFILTSLSYSNLEKDKFVDDFLLLYMSNEQFRKSEEDKRIVFVKFTNEEEFNYLGSFTESQLEEYENPEHNNLLCHQIYSGHCMYENVEIYTTQEECNLMSKPEPTTFLGRFLNTFKIGVESHISLKNKKLNINEKNCVLDTGASVTSFFYPENWNRQKAEFIEEGKFSDFFRYLNKIKNRVEYLSFEGNCGPVFKQVIFFNEDVYVNIGSLKVPLKVLSIPFYDNSSILIGMDFIQKTSWFSFNTHNGYKIILERQYENKDYLHESMYEHGIVFGYNDVNRFDVFEYKKDVSQYINCRLYKTRYPIKVIEIDSNIFYRKYGVHLYLKEKSKDDSYSLIQEIFPRLEYLFKFYDVIKFEWAGEPFFIFRNINYMLKRLNITEVLNYDQNDMEKYKLSRGIFQLDPEILFSIN